MQGCWSLHLLPLLTHCWNVASLFYRYLVDVRVYSRTLLGTIIHPILLEIVENDICLRDTRKQMPFFQKKMCPPKNASMPPVTRIGPGCSSELVQLVPLSYSQWEGLLFIVIDWMTFLPPFLDVTRMCMSTVSFLAKLDYRIICL